MVDTADLMEARRAVLQEHLRGEFAQAPASPRAIPRRPPGSPIPLSFGQEQLWFLTHLAPEVPAYNEVYTVCLPGPLNVAALERSFNEIIRRHEIWRTTFPTVDGQPIQVIHPAPTLRLPVVDLRELPVARREAEALRRATQEARQPFDLAQGPLLRATLMRLDVTDYKLYLTLHHAICDGISIFSVFLPELAALYKAFCAGRPSPLPELPIQYADFAVWQRQWLQSDVLEDHLAYWTRQLSGAPPLLELPTDRPRPVTQTHRGALHAIVLSRSLTEALKGLSRREGVTLFMTLVAAFKALLYRYSGQDDILLGIASAERKRGETEGLIGHFLNALVLRTDLGGNPTFRELMVRVREVMLEAYAHDEVPFERLVEHLRPERALSQNQLFQVMLSLQPPLAPLEPGWTLSRIDVDTETAKLDVSLTLDERAEGIIGRCEYSTDLFDAATIARMLEHWQVLLQSVASDPGQRLSEVPLLTEAERQQLLVTWNDTQADYPRNMCIHQLFEAQVERTPDAVAVVFEGEQLSYQELNRRANQLAHHLQRLGVGPEVLVGLCMERSLEMVVGLLGILKAGGAYVPLDPTYPSERLAFMLADAQVPVLVTQQHLATHLPAHDAHVVCLDADAAVLAEQSRANPTLAAAADNLAYVIYTSGSTGRPKGVQIPHHAVVNFLLSMSRQPGLTEADTLLAVTTLSFDIAAFELFLPLIVGARLVVASRDVAANGALLAEALARSGATVMQATPVTWRLLLAAGWRGERGLKILCGGEALPRELAQQLLPAGASLWNVYGPTETAIWSTACQITPEDEVVSIGRPIANIQIYLLDEYRQPVPIGVPGELHIGGAGLARGYLDRPELTAERFIPHSLSDEPGARLYKTGDLARYRADGTIELLGRLDHQVKIRGYRIEPGEIEAVLQQHAAVREAVVLAREDAPSDKRLVAYVVPQAGSPPTPSELRLHLRAHLPEYMLPAAIVLLDALPLTPNGKLDRRALPPPDQMRPSLDEAYVAPRTAVEELLAGIWTEVLGLERVGVHDNFFELGGHSLLAVRVVHRIEQRWGKKIALATLFAGPTIEQLAWALLEARDNESGVRAPVVPLQTGDSRRPFFFLHGHYLGTPYYCFLLARGLGPDQPFYALDPYRFDDLAVPPILEEIAATHLEALRAIQPAGPYLLGGFCNGGLVAYEMARQLHAAGQAVDLLVLLDPMPLPQHFRLLYRVLHGVLALVRLSPAQQVAWFVRLRHLVQQLYNYVHDLHGKAVKDAERVGGADQRERGQRRDEAGRARPGLAALTLVDDTLHRDYVGILHWAVVPYRPPSVYPGKITFFWPADEPWHARWWRPVVGATEVEEHLLPGTQVTCKTDHLPALSERLRLCLDNAHAAVKTPVAGAQTDD